MKISTYNFIESIEDLYHMCFLVFLSVQHFQSNDKTHKIRVYLYKES